MAPSRESARDDPARPNPVLDALGDDPADVDALMARTGLAADAVAVTLMELELAGTVASLPGGRWQRRHA
jgi:DNA processing protein